MRAILFTAVVLATGCGSSRSAPRTFAHLELLRGDGVLGSILPRGTVTSAVVERAADGSLTMKGTRREADPGEVEKCLDQNSSCIINRPFDAIRIDPGKADTLTALVSVLPEPGCHREPNLECDPPVDEDLIVDGLTYYSSACCTLDQEPFQAAHPVMSLLDGLMPAR